MQNRWQTDDRLGRSAPPCRAAPPEFLKEAEGSSHRSGLVGRRAGGQRPRWLILTFAPQCSLNPLVRTTQDSWFLWALLSAVFAALTAIFAKVGVQGVDSDLTTLVRTFIILFVLSAFVWGTGKRSNPLASPSTADW